MARRKKIRALAVACAGLALVPLPAAAQTFFNAGGGIAGLVSELYTLGVRIAVVLGFLAIFAGGYLWMFGKPAEAKKMIQNAILGMTIALTSFVILYAINPNLTNFSVPSLAAFSKMTFELDSLPEVQIEEEKSPDFVARSSMSGKRGDYDALFKKYAEASGIDCTLLKAIAYQESSLNAAIGTNRKGATGLMQVIGGRWGRPSNDELNDPETNVRWGTAIIMGNLKNPCPKRCKNGLQPFSGCVKATDFKNVITGNGSFTPGVQYALAGYNAGPCRGNVASSSCSGKAKWQCPGELNETHNYIPAVLGHYKKMKENGWGC